VSEAFFFFDMAKQRSAALTRFQGSSFDGKQIRWANGDPKTYQTVSSTTLYGISVLFVCAERECERKRKLDNKMIKIL